MTRNLIRSLAAMAGLSVALAACDGTGPDRPAGVTLLLTDAPGNVEQAWVKVDRVYLQGTGGQTDLLTTQSEWIELTALEGENFTTLAASVAVPPGNYSQMRVVVTEALLVANGKTYGIPGSDFSDLPDEADLNGEPTDVLHGPSFAQTGIKVGMPAGGFTVPEADIPVTLIVDFDVARSFGREAGASGRWVMHPALRATDVSVSGRIEGHVATHEEVVLQCGNNAISVEYFIPTADEGPLFATGTVEPDSEDPTSGTYLMAYVHPGTYTMGHEPEAIITIGDANWLLEFEAEARDEGDDQIVEVTVGPAESVVVNYLITGITCTEIED